MSVRACSVFAFALVCSVQAFVPSLQAGRVSSSVPRVARPRHVAAREATHTVSMYSPMSSRHTRAQRTELNARVGRYSVPEKGEDVVLEQEPTSRLGRLRKRVNVWCKRLLVGFAGQEDPEQAEYEAAMAAYATRALAAQQAKAAALEAEQNPPPKKAPPKKNSSTKSPAPPQQRRPRSPAESPRIVHMDVSKQASPEDEDMMAGLRRRMQMMEQKRAAEEKAASKKSSDDEDSEDGRDSSARSSGKTIPRPSSKRPTGRSSAGSAVMSRPDGRDSNRNNKDSSADKDSESSADADTQDPEVVRFASDADIERLRRMFGSNSTSNPKGQ